MGSSFFLENGEKDLRFQKNPDACGRGLRFRYFSLSLSWHKCHDSFIQQTSSLECKKQKHYCLPKMQFQQWAKFDTPLTHSAVADGRCSADWTQPSTSISQPIVIACPQQASNNHMELQNTYRNFSSSLRFSVFVWMAENDSNTLSVDGYVIYFFLVNGERDLCFQKIPIRVDGA